MASLKKPAGCSCGSVTSRHKYYPERWVCMVCDTVIVQRATVPPNGVCRDCGARKGPNTPFKKDNNQCKACAHTYERQWRARKTLVLKGQ